MFYLTPIREQGILKVSSGVLKSHTTAHHPSVTIHETTGYAPFQLMFGPKAPFWKTELLSNML